MKKIVCLILAAIIAMTMASAVLAEEAAVYENPLTGVYDLDQSAVDKRPVAVMINNHPDSYPQYNIGQADIIYEVVVEHDLTRMLALFADYTNVPYLVSVRSYRYYFPQISQGYDAFYIHWGEDQTMMDYYYELGLDAYNGLENDYLFGRDEERLSWGFDTEHTSAFYGANLPQQLEWDAKRTDIRDDMKGPAFSFVPAGTVISPEGYDCNFVNINYGRQTTQFTYDQENGVYRKFALGQPQIDGISGEQLAFENVFVLYTEIYNREDEPEVERKWLDVMGGLDCGYAIGYYLSEGKAESIKWAKDGVEGRLKFYTMSGDEIQINRGKTYITYTYPNSAQLSVNIPEEYQQ